MMKTHKLFGVLAYEYYLAYLAGLISLDSKDE